MSAASRLKKVSHVIFDMDGVLIDSEIIYKNAISAIARRFGAKYTPRIQAKLIGTVARESSRIAVTEMKLPMTVDQFRDEFRTLSNKQFATSPPLLMPGAERLVKHLKRHDVPIAIATSSSQDSFELKTRKYRDLFRLFNHVVCGGSDPEVKEGKPKPDVFLVCASRFVPKPTPEDCLVVEDAPNGVKAALSAGMQVVMIPDENIPEEMRKDAHWVVNSLEDIPLEKFGLPALK